MRSAADHSRTEELGDAAVRAARFVGVGKSAVYAAKAIASRGRGGLCRLGGDHRSQAPAARRAERPSHNAPGEATPAHASGA